MLPFVTGFIWLAVAGSAAVTFAATLVATVVVALWRLVCCAKDAVVWVIGRMQAGLHWAAYCFRAWYAICRAARPHAANNLRLLLVSNAWFLSIQCCVFFCITAFVGKLPGGMVLVLLAMLRWLHVRLAPQVSNPVPDQAADDLVMAKLSTCNRLCKLSVGAMIFLFDASAALVASLAVLNVSAMAIAIIAAFGFFLAFYMLFTGVVFLAPTYAQLYKLCAAACMDSANHAGAASRLLFKARNISGLQMQIRLWFPRVWGLEAWLFPHDPVVQQYVAGQVTLSAAFVRALNTERAWRFIPGQGKFLVRALTAQICSTVYHNTLYFLLFLCVALLPVGTVIFVGVFQEQLKSYILILTNPHDENYWVAVAPTVVVLIAIGLVLFFQVIVTVLVWMLHSHVANAEQRVAWLQWGMYVASLVVPYCRIGRYAEGRLPDIWAWQQQQALLGPHTPRIVPEANADLEVWLTEAVRFIHHNCVGAWALIEFYYLTECLRVYSLLLSAFLAVMLLAKGPTYVGLRVGLVVLGFGVTLLKSSRDKWKLLERAIAMWGYGGGLLKALENLCQNDSLEPTSVLTYFNVLARIDAVAVHIAVAATTPMGDVICGKLAAIVTLFVDDGAKVLVPELFKTSFL
jgi:hypothetical protein